MALLTIINHWNEAINNKEINLAVFVVEKIAFDILVLKLFFYIMGNFFYNRHVIKDENFINE
jgi:hypothetical protein